MERFQIGYWPILVTGAVTAFAALFNLVKDARIPNWLTFPFILSGLTLGLLHSARVGSDAGTGGVVAAFLAAVLGFMLCLPVYLTHMVGAGSVKLQMGISAWIGAFYGLLVGASLVLWAVLFSVLFCLIAALIHRAKLKGKLYVEVLPTGVGQCLGFLTAIELHEIHQILPLLF
jgi:Flp pilus assembly protein protease CpaA